MPPKPRFRMEWIYELPLSKLHVVGVRYQPMNQAAIEMFMAGGGGCIEYKMMFS